MKLPTNIKFGMVCACICVICLSGCETLGTREPVAPSMKSIPKERYFICFDKEFYQEDEAEFWALAVRHSLNNPPEQFLIEDNTGYRRKYKVCLGPFQNKSTGEERLSHIADAMNMPMFIEQLE